MTATCSWCQGDRPHPPTVPVFVEGVGPRTFHAECVAAALGLGLPVIPLPRGADVTGCPPARFVATQSPRRDRSGDIGSAGERHVATP